MSVNYLMIIKMNFTLAKVGHMQNDRGAKNV